MCMITWRSEVDVEDVGDLTRSLNFMWQYPYPWPRVRVLPHEIQTPNYLVLHPRHRPSFHHLVSKLYKKVSQYYITLLLDDDDDGDGVETDGEEVHGEQGQVSTLSPSITTSN